MLVLLLGLAAVEDDLDEVVTDERIVEVLQHIGIDGPERATGLVLHAIAERAQNPVLEIGSRMRSGDRPNCLGGQIVTTDAQHVSLDTRGDKRDFGLQELRHAGRRMQRDSKPHLTCVGFVDATLQQEVPCRVGAVDLEPKHRRPVALGQPDVVEHGAGIEQFGVGLQPTLVTLQCAELVHPAGVVVQKLIFGVADLLGDFTHERRVGDDDVGEALRGWGGHGRTPCNGAGLVVACRQCGAVAHLGGHV